MLGDETIFKTQKFRKFPTNCKHLRFILTQITRAHSQDSFYLFTQIIIAHRCFTFHYPSKDFLSHFCVLKNMSGMVLLSTLRKKMILAFLWFMRQSFFRLLLMRNEKMKAKGRSGRRKVIWNQVQEFLSFSLSALLWP